MKGRDPALYHVTYSKCDLTNWSSPQCEWLRALYEVLQEVRTIKIRNHCFVTRNILWQWLNTCKNAPETILRRTKIQVLSLKWTKSQTKAQKMGDMVTCKGEREVSAVSRRLPDNLGEFACMNRKLPARLSWFIWWICLCSKSSREIIWISSIATAKHKSI